MVLKVDHEPAMEEEIKAAAAMAVERLARHKTTKVVTTHLSPVDPQPEGWGE